MESTQLPKLIAVVGPTASGKTDIAISLAKRFKGEVISADSRQFYRGTEIGSAVEPGKWVKKYGRRIYVAHGVPHHLISFLPASRTFTVSQFKDHVIRIARDIRKRGHVPIICGGSGLFIRAVVDNFDIPEVPANVAFRAKMEKRTTAALYKELLKKDPAYASRIPANNRRYAIRALEVIQATGKPFSEVQGRGEPIFDVLQIGVKRERQELFRRIDLRVDRMMKSGLLDEARTLGKKYGWAVPAATGLGHRQLGQYLRGEITLPEAVERIKIDTRHYAKRQTTWFRREERIRWIKNKQAAERLVKRFLKVE
jgi:tRNA dimethylallyltransferase